jgi:hypothetical protein
MIPGFHIRFRLVTLEDPPVVGWLRVTDIADLEA